MEASGSSCGFATSQGTTVSDEDPDPAVGLGAIDPMNLPGVTLA
ncbi:hypothetical protein [Phormidesmis priestleyi]|nr:hypothetical protein [Phormidesmis priestleyi]